MNFGFGILENYRLSSPSLEKRIQGNSSQILDQVERFLRNMVYWQALENFDFDGSCLDASFTNASSNHLDWHNTEKLFVSSEAVEYWEKEIRDLIDGIWPCDCLTSSTAEAWRCRGHMWLYKEQRYLLDTLLEDIPTWPEDDGTDRIYTECLDDLRQLLPLLPCLSAEFHKNIDTLPLEENS